MNNKIAEACPFNKGCPFKDCNTKDEMKNKMEELSKLPEWKKLLDKMGNCPFWKRCPMHNIV